MMNYRCAVCGCYLDPGEGRICEDCKKKKPQQTGKHLQEQAKKKTFKMLKKINDPEILIKIYTMVDFWFAEQQRMGKEVKEKCTF